MKKNFLKILGLVLLTISLFSCKKWVDYNPHDDFRVTELDYLKTESDYRTLAVSVYTPLQWLNQIVQVGDIASDNSVAGGENASDVLSFQQMDDFTVTSDNGTLTDLWQAAYEGVNRANYMLQYKEQNPAGQKVDFAGKDALYGEVYFNRAYFYFTLVKVFGDVPFFVDRRLGVSDSRKLQRTPKAEVYQQIEKDLLAAAAALPPTQAQKGRITKWAAQAMLAKVYLYQNKFTDAAPLLDGIITNGGFSLVTNFGNMFLQAGENGPESVFEIQYSNSSPYYNWGGVTRGQGNLFVQQSGVRGISGTASMPYSAGWSTGLPTADLANAYQAGDQRKAATIFDVEAYKVNNPALNVSYQVAPYKNTGFYNQKYLPRKGETSGQIELNYLNNYRTIRYAEVLLMAAEAWNRSSTPDDGKARGYLNQVRQRAFADMLHNIATSGPALTQDIWKERRLELGMEGDRYFDLVRTGQAAAKMPKFVVGKNEVFPIPLQEVTISGIKQNPGF